MKDEALNLGVVGCVGGSEDDEETVMSRLARWRQRLRFESRDLEPSHVFVREKCKGGVKHCI